MNDHLCKPIFYLSDDSNGATVVASGLGVARRALRELVADSRHGEITIAIRHRDWCDKLCVGRDPFRDLQDGSRHMVAFVGSPII